MVAVPALLAISITLAVRCPHQQWRNNAGIGFRRLC